MFLLQGLIMSPENCGAALYATGDYAQIKLENGLLYYEGRSDNQIKVRGHRVDLSEIEKAVNGLAAIDKAVVLCFKPNEPSQKVLCFFTSSDAPKVSKF